MRLRTYLAGIAKVLQTRNPRRPRNLPCRLELQRLDDRVVPSILFSNTGSRSIVDTGGPILRQMQVDLIFWGAHWTDAGNQTLRTNVQNTVNAILNSPYFDGLAQYRGIIHGSLLRSDIIATTSPGPTFQTASNGDLATMVANNINNGTLPGPNGQILYFVIPQPGSTASDCNGCGGRHLAGIASNNRVFPYGLVSNPAGVALETLSWIMSHEMAEAATNPEWNITVGGVSQAAFHVPGSNGDEIGDGEPDGTYLYRVHDAFTPQNTALVQAYLSQRDHAYIVTNGSTNNFLVSSSRVLTFQESAGGHNNIAINNIGNGVYAELNNSTAQFEPGAISSVQVDSVASGSNTIDIFGNPVPVTVTGSGTAGVFIGAAGRVTNIRSTVTVSTSAGTVALYVDDSADPNGVTVSLDRTHVSYGGPSISYSPVALSSLTLDGGIGGGSYTITDTPNAPTTLRTRGANTVLVRGNSSPLTIDGRSTSDYVEIGNGGRVNNILAPVSVTNTRANGTALVVSNSADPGNRTVTLGSTQISFGGPAISYGVNALGGLQLLGGTGVNTYTITGTPNTADHDVLLQTAGNGDLVRVLANASPVFINGGAPNRVEIGNNGRVTNIFRDITVRNLGGTTDLVNDNSADPGTYTVTITNGTVTYDNPNAVLRYSNLGSLTVRTGTGSATANVLSTSAPTNVVGAGRLTVNVGSGDTVQGIQAALSVSDPAGRLATVNVNDANDSADHDGTSHPLVTLDTITQGVESLRLQDLAPAAVYAASAQTTAFVLNGGSGYNVWNVEATPAGVSTVINGGSGFNAFEVSAQDAAGTDSLLGPLTLHGHPGSSYLVYGDQFAGSAQTYDVDTNGVSRAGLAPLTFDNLSEVILVTARVGGNAVNVRGVAADMTMALDMFDGDVATVGANQTLAAIQGDVVAVPFDNTSASVVIDDSGDATPPGPVTLTNTVYGLGITGVDSGGIYLAARQNTNLSTSLKLAAGDKTVNVQAAPQGVSLSLDAGDGMNTLDYTNYPDNVLVNLQTGTATGFSSIARIRNVTGASGGPAGSYNILVGNGGNVLTGGSGRRNLLVAGPSASTLIGGNGDDILIGGTTMYDQEADMHSLSAIMDYWAGTADDYFTRVNNLTTGTGVPLLDATTVFNNGGGNTLLGNGGGAGEMNLFYGLDPSLENTDYNPGIGEVFMNV
jgi:hypothetical protein